MQFTRIKYRRGTEKVELEWTTRTGPKQTK